MAIEKVKERLPNVPCPITQRELRPLLEALIDATQALAAKLDADATVTDTNYKAVFDAYVTK